MRQYMNEQQIVNYINVKEILRGKGPLIIVLFPNYEDRTHALIDSILTSLKEDDQEYDIDFIMFCLKNKSNNNMLLEDAKEHNIDLIKERLENRKKVNEFWLEYPSNFSPNALKMPIQKKLEEMVRCKGEKARILFDISTIPKSILFRLCEDIKEFIRGKIIGNIYFGYSLPKKYSEISYAQDVGLLKGLFSGEALHFSSGQSIHTILFPSRTGHEGKLLCDSLDSISRNTDYSIFFPVHKDDFIASLDVMQANQSLIDREAYLNYYYSTLDDAIKSLDELFQKEYVKISHIIKAENKNKDMLAPQVYLVAPFGAKVFLPIAYFELIYLRSISPEIITIEIVNVKGFQYTSLYSLGIGELTCFELNGEKVRDVLCKNQDL